MSLVDSRRGICHGPFNFCLHKHAKLQSSGIKDADIAIRLARAYIVALQGPEMDCSGWTPAEDIEHDGRSIKSQGRAWKIVDLVSKVSEFTDVTVQMSEK